ncbi:hypothetical protein JTE90_023690 [Oedothorax gibbosus]|uniref:Uncharacterized protein n=1 Tax=Oedothorax gibbosus TaxID=931172 RepID=A0AAV6TXM2_9ARAC|nr:hypothetical protein JTE90_023690 [Oedothorax gibbosus]
MKVLIALFVSLAVLGAVLADEGDYEKKKAKILSFYKCVACSPADVHASYKKCDDMKPEKLKKVVETCYHDVIGMEHDHHATDEDCWKNLCANPENIEKIHECMSKAKEDLKKSLTEEDMTSFTKFKECAKGVKEQYCNTDQ